MVSISFADPNPFIDYKNCSLKERGYICDPDEILEEDDSEYHFEAFDRQATFNCRV